MENVYIVLPRPAEKGGSGNKGFISHSKNLQSSSNLFVTQFKNFSVLSNCYVVKMTEHFMKSAV
jgi:hypothetical protein